MNIQEIQDLIKFVSKTQVSEVEIEQKDFKIIIKSNPKSKGAGEAQQPIYVQASAPVAPPVAPAPAAPVAAAPVVAVEDNLITIKSPMIGTFYRASGPDKDVFVNVGDIISTGSTVCVIEAMKLFNEIESEISGKIVKILVDDSTPVEYDQPLFLVEP
ncbi:MAG: acetyl-CoA carboxylase biotin carboxyl carrier protein [Patescibacteria group bacterium]|jgi:acetyl-CoA carboxylase biotin carboxyl carrier protein